MQNFDFLKKGQELASRQHDQKSLEKNLNILRTKRAFNIRVLSISFLKAEPTFLEGESLNLSIRVRDQNQCGTKSDFKCIRRTNKMGHVSG